MSLRKNGLTSLFKEVRVFKVLHKLFEHPQRLGTSQNNSRDIPGHRFLPAKPKEDKVSSAGTNFSTTTPSRGRPPPHPAVSGPRKLIFVLERS